MFCICGTALKTYMSVMGRVDALEITSKFFYNLEAFTALSL